MEKITTEAYFYILRGVYQKFYKKNPPNDPRESLVKWGEIGKHSEMVVKDIISYNLNLFENDETFRIDLKEKNELSELEDVIKKSIEKKSKTGTHKLADSKAFRDFESFLPNFFYSFDMEIELKMPSYQIQAICYYAFGKPLSDVLKNNYFFIQDGYIRMIPVRIRNAFLDDLSRVIKAFEAADSKSGSTALNKLALQIFHRKTKRDIDNLSKGEIFLTKDEYLTELSKLIELSDNGFGVSIPEFSSIWASEIGKEILESNLQHALGKYRDGKKPRESSQFIRIFFVESPQDGKIELEDGDRMMIQEQLEHEVRVVLIFKPAWEHLNTDELAKYDFAILKIEGCPSLMTTRFAGKDKEGVFFSAKDKPAAYFSSYLANVLTKKNECNISIPKLKDGKLVFQLCDEFSLDGIHAVLKRIYTSGD